MSTLLLNAMSADATALSRITNGDPIAITFFLGCMAMLASAVFFFFERSSVDPKWKLSLLVSGLITGIAAVHYYYMRDFYLATGQSPTAFRYVDWTLTVPLMCVEFYLLTKPFGGHTGEGEGVILALATEVVETALAIGIHKNSARTRAISFLITIPLELSNTKENSYCQPHQKNH